MARRIAAVVFTLGCLQASSVSALGLGDLTLDSFLNEPLDAKINLLNTEGLSDHQIRIRLATVDDFNRMGVDRAYFLTSISFEIEVDGSGHGTIVVTSDGPVLEPYLDFIIEARWPTGRLLREYTILVDPPVFDATQVTTISATEISSRADHETEAKKKSQTQSSSGTKVGLGQSKLAPGQMPRRDFGADASEAPLPGDRYMIRRDETLWGIAKRAKPDGTSINQTMLDIQRLNPKAFIGGNINRIKAGYIIYLPAASDISSDDAASAVAEVNQQNTTWRDDVSAGRIDARGGSLRISTGAQEENSSAVGGNSQNDGAGATADIANLESLERAEREREEVSGRLDAMAEQVETLERIVSIKDDQIAALQNALAEAQAGAGQAGEQALSQEVVSEAVGDPTPAPEPAPEVEAVAESEPEANTELVAEVETQTVADSDKVSDQEVKPAEASPVASTKPVEEEGGLFSNIWVIGGGLLAVVIAIWAFLRRRGGEEVEESLEKDVFADIHLEEENLEVVPETEAEPEPHESAAEDKAGEPASEPSRNRGYGEGKNDQYAADMDSVDAIAEADIYIAYGRFSQAIDLLKTAIESEPRNPVYKLKLMEVSEEVGDQAEVMKQFADIKALGDADSLARANEVLGNSDSSSASITSAIMSDDDPLELSDDFDIDLPDIDLEDTDTEIDLEDEFGELEIEGFGSELTEDDLDLSQDFVDKPTAVAGADEQEMVFSTEGDPVSTKLDLARAYLDMGDPDGAKAIFEEVVVEGNNEQKLEAQALLERLG